jgi:hypothetical protein
MGKRKSVVGRIICFFLLALMFIVFVSSADAQRLPGPTPTPTPTPPPGGGAGVCQRTITANVVALDQPFFQNRLGAFNPNGMMYALKRDVVNKDTLAPCSQAGANCTAGNVMLRPDKRPRPIVLRMNAGDCLTINFTNWLAPFPVREEAPFFDPINNRLVTLFVDDQPRTRQAGIHVNGMQLVGSILSDGSNVGRNSVTAPGPGGLNGLVEPGSSITYTFYGEFENVYMLNNMGAAVGAEGGGGTTAFGLFGAVNVEPTGSEWYRSQVNHEELMLATAGGAAVARTPAGQPIVDYDAVYPNVEPFISEGKAGLPIIRILNGNEIVHTDIHAIITGPNRGLLTGGPYPGSTYTQFADPSHSMLQDPVLGEPLFSRRSPFREITSIFHDETFTIQAFHSIFEDPVLNHTLKGIKDGFAINYGTGGIGSEILANRFGVGPMWDCVDCKAEEFFLTSWAVGDPAMVVNIPANGVAGGNFEGPKATFALYPDDPANVHHTYLNDAAKFRNMHAGPKEHHIFHLHGHQWTFTPLNDNGLYIDFQQIGPGSSYTYDILFGGSGNRNKHVGDMIYHCHFYPHFAQGMWALWRVHDVFEEGTVLEQECTKAEILGNACRREPFALFDGTPAEGARALPDGEVMPNPAGNCQVGGNTYDGVCRGTPIPAIVPMPGLAMPPVPAVATVNPADPRRVIVSPNPTTGETNPGFPLFVAGVAGHRPPTPPLDIIDDGGLPRHVVTGCDTLPCQPGLNFVEAHTRVDFNKEMLNAAAEQVPEDGTQVEKAAMAYHAVRRHNTFIAPLMVSEPLRAGKFVTNGKPPVRGAPFAQPCVDDKGEFLQAGVTPFFVGQKPTSPSVVQFGAANPRVYKGANIQLDVVFNKVGSHFNQERIITLWDDVGPTLAGTRPPEPFVMRGNVLDCMEYHHTNLVPNFYELDDFQVRTPTDIIGQHIHMIKFDVTSADGAANGWNYEDGTFSPDEVRERIEAFRAGQWTPAPGGPTQAELEPKPHPFFSFLGERALGARTTVQRWFVDPLLNNQGVDLGLRNIFTHDHFGPSTHQQLGLYGTFLVEPNASQWLSNESDKPLGTRADGGPTSWQARIITGPGGRDSFREFYHEWSDFQQAYRADWDGTVDADSFLYAVNPSVRESDLTANRADPKDILEFLGVCPGGVPRPCPEAIAADDIGTFVTSYRNEPVGLRVFDPTIDNGNGTFGAQAGGLAGDLAFAFQSRTDRAIPALNSQMQSCVRDTPLPPLRTPGDINPANPVTNFAIGPELSCPQLTFDVRAGDPATPMMRVYDNDIIMVRIQVGATEESHNVTMHGLKWLQEWTNPSSGWRNNQSMGISEMFLLKTPVLPDRGQIGETADYFWSTSVAADGLWNGAWGVLRAYAKERPDLKPLPNNPIGQGIVVRNPGDFTNIAGFLDACPRRAPRRLYDITAVRAADVLPAVAGIPNPFGAGDARTLLYNSRPDPVAGFSGGPLHNPTALLYVETANVLTDGAGNPTGLKPGTPVEPLILRARAGECVEVTLRNKLTLDLNGNVPDLHGWANLPGVWNLLDAPDGAPVEVTFNMNKLSPSKHVGLHPQLLEFDITKGDGMNVGINPVQTAGPGETKVYHWYAGDVRFSRDTGLLTALPVEFGGANLAPADMIKQVNKGLGGAIVIEPSNATWTTDPGTRAQATVTQSSVSFREFVSVYQTFTDLWFSDNIPVPGMVAEGLGAGEDAEDAGNKSINYKTEPAWFRLGFDPRDIIPGAQQDTRLAQLYSNTLLNPDADPQTPIFTAKTGTPVRFHMLQPGGSQRNFTLSIHGHLWEREPYNANSTIQGPTLIVNNPSSQRQGSQEGFGSMQHFTFVPKNGAGGLFRVNGDYLIRPQSSWHNMAGMWNIFRVTP